MFALWRIVMNTVSVTTTVMAFFAQMIVFAAIHTFHLKCNTSSHRQCSSSMHRLKVAATSRNCTKLLTSIFFTAPWRCVLVWGSNVVRIKLTIRSHEITRVACRRLHTHISNCSFQTGPNQSETCTYAVLSDPNCFACAGPREFHVLAPVLPCVRCFRSACHHLCDFEECQLQPGNKVELDGARSSIIDSARRMQNDKCQETNIAVPNKK